MLRASLLALRKNPRRNRLRFYCMVTAEAAASRQRSRSHRFFNSCWSLECWRLAGIRIRKPPLPSRPLHPMEGRERKILGPIPRAALAMLGCPGLLSAAPPGLNAAVGHGKSYGGQADNWQPLAEDDSARNPDWVGRSFRRRYATAKKPAAQPLRKSWTLRTKSSGMPKSKRSAPVISKAR